MLCAHFMAGNTVVTAAVVETQKSVKLKSTLKLDFMFDFMTLVLYSPNANEVRNPNKSLIKQILF